MAVLYSWSLAILRGGGWVELGCKKVSGAMVGWPVCCIVCKSIRGSQSGCEVVSIDASRVSLSNQVIKRELPRPPMESLVTHQLSLELRLS